MEASTPKSGAEHQWWMSYTPKGRYTTLANMEAVCARASSTLIWKAQGLWVTSKMIWSWNPNGNGINILTPVWVLKEMSSLFDIRWARICVPWWGLPLATALGELPRQRGQHNQNCATQGGSEWEHYIEPKYVRIYIYIYIYRDTQSGNYIYKYIYMGANLWILRHTTKTYARAPFFLNHNRKW